MKGAKFLTWSRALRAWVGLGASVKDRAIAADRGQPLGSLPAPAWRAIRDAIDFASGRAVTLRALEIGERLGVRRALEYCWREAAPRMKGPGRTHGNQEKEETLCKLREPIHDTEARSPLRALPVLPTPEHERVESQGGSGNRTGDRTGDPRSERDRTFGRTSDSVDNLEALAVALTAAAFVGTERYAVPGLRRDDGPNVPSVWLP